MPAFNGAATLTRTVQSVLAQSFTDLQVIVVDDGSHDTTPDVARRIADRDGRVLVMTPAHAGVSAARNTGARAALGEYLVFLDCDDEVAPNWLERFRALIDLETGDGRASTTDIDTDAGFEHRRPDLVFGAARALVPVGATRHWQIEHLGPAFGDIDGVFFPGMFAVRRSLFASVGGYEVALRFSENTELGLRLTERSQVEHGIVSSRVHHEELLTVYLPPGGNSNSYSDPGRFESALYLVDIHHRLLQRDPRLHASYWAIAGVAAARLARGRDAVHCFARAARTDPGDPRHLGRLAVSLFAPLRARRWPGRSNATSAPVDDASFPASVGR